MSARTPHLLALAAIALAVPPALAPGDAGAQQQKGTLPSFRDQRRYTSGGPADGQPPASDVRPAIPAAPPEQAPAAAQPAAAAEPAPAAPVAAAEARRPGVVVCGQAVVTAAPLPAGRMKVAVESACRAGQDIAWTYGGAELEARFDAAGRAEIVVDCFAGTSTPVVLRFTDTSTVALPVTAKDLDAVSKVALIWRAAVDLDLHAFEYAARRGEPGHVWSGAPSSYSDADESRGAEKRGVGFLSSESRGDGRLDKLEVYTFLHRDGQAHGLVATAIDFASRGSLAAAPHCGEAASAEVAFRIAVLARGAVRTEWGLVAAQRCGATIADAVRFGDSAVLPTIAARR